MNNIVIIILIVGILSWGYSIWQSSKRKKNLKRIAENMGFNFRSGSWLPKEYRKVVSTFLKLSFLTRIQNIISKDFEKYKLSIFDYNVFGNDETLFVFTSDETKYPHFDLYPNNFNNKCNIPIDSKRFSFPTYPIFSEKYLLNGKDETAIKIFFNNKLLTYLAETEGFAISGRGNHLLIGNQNYQLVPPDEIYEQIDIRKKVYKYFWDAACKI